MQNQNTATLHQQFVKLGREKHRIEYQLLQLLPAIFKSEIYKKYAHTIEGYAWRFAQLSASVVQKRLRLEKHLENKPALKAAIAEVGVHKVALVASIATAETDAIFADKVLNMSKPAVQELSKELRDKGFGEIGKTELQGSLELKNEIIQKSNQEVQETLLEEFPGNQIDLKCKARTKIIKLELDEELAFMFLKIKQEMGKNLSHRETIRKIFEKVLDEHSDKQNKILHDGQKTISNLEIDNEETGSIKSKKVIPGDNLNIENFTAESSETVISLMDLTNNKKSNLDSKSIIAESANKTPTITISPGSKVEGDKKSLESPNPPRPTFESEPLSNLEEELSELYQSSSNEEKSAELSQDLSVLTKSVSIKPSSRHIPADQKRLALKQSNHHCSYPNCNKPAEVFHHPERFSKTKNHKNLKPLCKIHHEFMHNGMIKGEVQTTNQWTIELKKELCKTDQFYRQYRKR